MSSNKQYDKINRWIEMLYKTDLESPQGMQLSMLISDRIAWAIKFKEITPKQISDLCDKMIEIYSK